MNPKELAEYTAYLTERGFAVRMCDGVLEVRDFKAERRAERARKRNHQNYLKRKRAKLLGATLFTGDSTLMQDAETALKPVETGLKPVETGLNLRPSVNQIWRGITWRDVPGCDEAAKKMRFSLLKRGDWRGYKSCQYLEGQALKDAFAKANATQKAKSHKAAAKRTEEAKKRRAAIPETTSLQSR